MVITRRREKKLSEEQKNQLREKFKTVAFDNRNQIISLKKTVRKTLPVQGNILRRSALISLMATFETLISQLIREFYYKYPEALPSESKSLSLAALRDLGSVEEAEKFLIDNEIDSILRGNIQSQIACFEKPIKISLKPMEKYFEQIIELSQRRNLLVHNDGKVNRHYLNKVPKSFLISDIKEGDKIKVPSSYLMSGIQTIHLLGTILIQQCFRKWEKENIDEANDILVDLSYDSLIERNYIFTENLAEYAYAIDVKSDKYLRIRIINHCIALREQEKLEEMERVLSRYDWSTVSLTFKLALNALRGEEDKLYSNLNRAIAIDDIHVQNLHEWPLFNNFRNTEKFKEYFKEKFPDFETPSMEEADDTTETEEPEEELEK